jgi:hypothetical protein
LVGNNFPLIFAECSDPRKPIAAGTENIALAHLKILSEFGFRVVDIPYVRPPCKLNGEYVDMLLLVSDGGEWHRWENCSSSNCPRTVHIKRLNSEIVSVSTRATFNFIRAIYADSGITCVMLNEHFLRIFRNKSLTEAAIDCYGVDELCLMTQPTQEQN